MEKKGIEETLEMIAGLEKIGKGLANAFKDGAQVSDIFKVFRLVDDFKDTFDEMKKVKAEMGDIDLEEAQEITDAAKKMIFAIIKEVV